MKNKKPHNLKGCKCPKGSDIRFCLGTIPDVDSRIYHYQKLVWEAHKKGDIDKAFLDNVFYGLLDDFKKVVSEL